MTPPRSRACPRRAGQRLQQNRAGLFTSDLSVNEFLLVKQAGFEPLGLVVGSSIYHIGHSGPGWKRSQEMTVLSQAMYERSTAGDDAHGGGGRPARRRRRGGRAPGYRPLRVGSGHGRVHRDRHRGQARRRRLHRGAQRPPLHERSLGPGLLDAAAHGPPPGGHGHGQLRLPRRPSAACSSRWPRPGATSSCRTSPRPSTTRASSRWSGCRARPRRSPPRASSACSSQEKSHGWGSHTIEFFVDRHRDRARRGPAGGDRSAHPGAGPLRLSKFANTRSDSALSPGRLRRPTRTAPPALHHARGAETTLHPGDLGGLA